MAGQIVDPLRPAARNNAPDPSLRPLAGMVDAMTDNSPATDEEVEAARLAYESVSPINGTKRNEAMRRALNAASRIRAETAKNSGEVAAATDGKQVVTMAAEGAWQAGAWDGNSIEALIDQYANGIYIGKISKPPLSVCVGHLREFATKLLALATPANSRAEAIGADVRNYGARGSIFDADPIRKAAWNVVLEVDRIHDNEPWPLKYRAPYQAIVELRALLQQEGE